MATWFKSKIASIRQSYLERRRKEMVEESKHLINLIKEDPRAALININSVNPHTVFDEHGRTLLHIAAEYGNFPIACYALNKYVDVNPQDYEGQTPLMLAVQHDRKAICTLLINSNADIHIRDNYGKSALQVVCSMSIIHSHIISIFLNKVRRDCWNDSAKIALTLVSAGCPLRHATYLHDPEVIRIMLESGCPIDTVDPDTGKTALHVAFDYASSDNIKLLLKHGANIDAMDFKNRSPYFSCGMWGESDKDLEITAIIIKRSALLTTSDESGIIQIGNLLHQGKEGAVMIILRSNIDLSTKDTYGRTLMHYLALNPIMYSNQRLQDELRRKKFHPNACDKDGISILLNASMIGNLKLMEFLLELGADVNAVTVHNHTPLLVIMCPSEHLRRRNLDSQQCVELLLMYGANLEFVLARLNTVLLTFLNSRDLFIERNESFAAEWWKRELSPPVVAQLALCESKGAPIVIETVEDAINYDPKLKRRFDQCKQQLEHLKRTKVYESLTLFQLLTESIERIAIYARNDDFLNGIKAFNDHFCSNSFYSNFLRKNIQRAVKIMEARREIAEVLCEVMDLSYQSNFIIIDKIVFYAMP